MAICPVQNFLFGSRKIKAAVKFTFVGILLIARDRIWKETEKFKEEKWEEYDRKKERKKES